MATSQSLEASLESLARRIRERPASVGSHHIRFEVHGPGGGLWSLRTGSEGVNGEYRVDKAGPILSRHQLGVQLQRDAAATAVELVIDGPCDPAGFDGGPGSACRHRVRQGVGDGADLRRPGHH